MTPSARRASTDAEGRFVLLDLPRLPHALWAIAEGLPDAKQDDVRVDGAPTTLRFGAGGRILGRVVDGQGQPVRDFVISHTPEGPNPARRPPTGSQIRDPEGRFALPGLRAGSYFLQVATVAGAQADRKVTLEPGRDQTVLIELAAAIELAGQVVDYDSGGPLAGASVSTTGPVGHRIVSTGADGRFQIAVSPLTGRAHLSAVQLGYAFESLTIDLPAAAPIVLRLITDDEAKPRSRLSRGLRVRGSPAGAEITEVSPGPVAVAGVAPGDVLTAIDGRSVAGLGESSVYRLLDRATVPLRLTLRSQSGPLREVLLTPAATEGSP